MRWLSRWLRPPDHPRMAVTVVSHRDSIVADSATEQWSPVFSLLDSRGIPATWATGARDTARLASLLVGSRVSHELAHLDFGRAVAANLPSFRHQSQLAQKVSLPLRTLVTLSRGVHPSVLAQLQALAVVPLHRRGAISHTGQLRALAWNIWEAPATDRTTTSPSDETLARLKIRVRQVVRQSSRLHLVIDPEFPLAGGELQQFERWLDQVSDYAQRGWIRFETVAQAASDISSSLQQQRSLDRQAA
ncbi:hypothetical protein [Aeoliella mucimassa]|uniref:Uncharacterized protein n=1 Tax=Aeoliella mucimassa TaxID=2527972 RepID=A0A518AMB8_9BACT|nr:hypothetical protein [Aeoliella mucimassa]QDU55869.1 hypothetical protein Pan181_20660 [Aeoliella mucimassa]